MRSTARQYTRNISLLLILALTWDACAHAAKPSSKLAALQAAVHQQGPAATSSTPARSSQASTPAPGLSARQRMLAAHTVYLEQPTLDPHFAASATATYNAVLDALNQWGRYRVVAEATEADLVLQLHGQVTEVDDTGTPPDYTPSVYFLSNLHLTVADPHSLSPLWEAKAPLQNGITRKARTLHVSTSGQILVSDLKLAVGDQLTTQDRASLKSIHTAHQRAIVFGVLGIGALAGFTILGIHLARRNAANFCQQHNLSPCPGA